MTSRVTSAASRFFRKQDDKPLPAPPPASNFPRDALPLTPSGDIGGGKEAFGNAVAETTIGAEKKPLPSRPAKIQSTKSQARTVAGEVSGATQTVRTADLVAKKRPSLASLRRSSMLDNLIARFPFLADTAVGSRIFRPATGDIDAPPPVPQIPIDTPTPKPRRPVIRPVVTARSAQSSLSSSGRKVSISRPVTSAQVSLPQTEFNIPNTTFVKPSRPPPPRPPRPESVDWELVALSRDVGSRMVLHTPQHTRTPTVSTTSSARSRALTRVQSEDVYSRLGLPSGHSSVSTPRSLTFDSPLSSPLAANFPQDPSRPLPFRDSSGSVKGYGRFSAYVKARQQYRSGAYEDGVDPDDRELGPIEQYRASRCADWTLEKRVSGKLGERGMLFRDRRGGWHFVADF